MIFEDIIASFAKTDELPLQAIEAALAEPQAFVDKAVALLEKIAARQSSQDEDAASVIVVHVLGEIGNQRAFAPLMQVLRLPSEQVDLLLGDSITETVGRILIGLKADQAMLEDALVDLKIDDFVRDACFDAWTYLALTTTISREQAKTFLADYPLRVGLDSGDFGWSSWVDAVTVLGFVEFTDFARQHLAKEIGSIFSLDTPSVFFDDFEDQMSKTLADPDWWRSEDKYQAFDDTIEELAGWHRYSEVFEKQPKWLSDDDDESPLWGAGKDAAIASNPYRDVGRNDPCPCGSGQKFKKCCLIDA